MVPTEGTGVGGSEGRFAEIENPQIIISEDMSLPGIEGISINCGLGYANQRGTSTKGTLSDSDSFDLILFCCLVRKTSERIVLTARKSFRDAESFRKFAPATTSTDSVVTFKRVTDQESETVPREKSQKRLDPGTDLRGSRMARRHGHIWIEGRPGILN
jgi:hypothetical protein